MDPHFLRDLVHAYINADSKESARNAFIILEFYLLKNFLEDYEKTNGSKPPNGYENMYDLRVIAETAILIHGGEIWHEETINNDSKTNGGST